MAASLCRLTIKTNLLSKQQLHHHLNKNLHLTAALERTQAGKFKVSLHHNKPLTYEQANPPPTIGHIKAWNSWNTSCLFEGPRASETAVEDIFIRKFMFGTWHRQFLTEVIIKRRHNMIFIGGIIKRSLLPRKIYFLIGYTEEILSYILKCPVKLELQSVEDPKEVIFKYV